jgi:Erv1 / Alr family
MKDIVKPYGIQMDFYAVSCVPNKRLCKQEEIRGYPTLKVFKAGSNNGTITKYFDIHPFQVLREVGIQVDVVDTKEDNHPAIEERHLKNGNSAKQFVLNLADAPKRTKAEIFADAYLSFHFAMKTGVYMANGPLPNNTVPVLRNWLELLQNTLPPTWNIHPLITRLLERFHHIIQGEDEMVEVLDQFPPLKDQWSFSCTHGNEAMGYTCGLWELFHIMTVGVVEYNEKTIGDDGYGFYRTEDVATTLRDYIANFFGCEVCRMNFLHAFDTCALDRCNRLQGQVGDLTAWKQLPMWLYEMHVRISSCSGLRC